MPVSVEQGDDRNDLTTIPLDHAPYKYSRGLSTAPGNLRIKINPVRILFLDQRYFPGSRPFLETLFALDCMFDVVEDFEINQPGHLVLFGETLADFQLVLANAPDQIIRDADIE